MASRPSWAGRTKEQSGRGADNSADRVRCVVQWRTAARKVKSRLPDYSLTVARTCQMCSACGAAITENSFIHLNLLNRIQEGYQVVVLSGRKPDLESCIIEIDQVVIFYRRAVVEVRRLRY